MWEIYTTRIKGAGKGKEIGFPTVNCEVNELPEGMTIGLYASSLHTGWTTKAISLISKTKTNTFRIETHVLDPFWG